MNQLVLLNNSKRPLILLAGEIVTGGKQDRVIGKDRIVPAESDPIDLNVFCVEPGRWNATSPQFGRWARPSPSRRRPRPWVTKTRVRSGRRFGRNRRKSPPVWPAPKPLWSTARLPMRRLWGIERYSNGWILWPDPSGSYQSLIGHLRDRNAVGVVVAVNGEIVWADIFASTNLLEKYWPKLVRSYAAEAIVTQTGGREVGMTSAQAFLDNREGRRETVENEPGIYRHTEIAGPGFTVFELTSLLPKTGFALHVAKMAE